MYHSLFILLSFINVILYFFQMLESRERDVDVSALFINLISFTY